MEAMAATFIFVVTAPEGTIHSHFELQDDYHYSPEDIVILSGLPEVSRVERLTLTMTGLPDDETYRELAAQAATSQAEVITDPIRLLIRRLIPF